MSSEETMTLSVTIKARRDDVFMALTDSDLIHQWSGEEATVGRTVGGEFALFNRRVTGRVLDFKPPRLVSFSWRAGEWPEGSPESLVVLSLEEEENGTRVTLTHRGFPNVEEGESQRTRWMEQVFGPLKRFLETGEVAESARSSESREPRAKKTKEQETPERKPVKKKARGSTSSKKSTSGKRSERKPVKKGSRPVKKRASASGPVKKAARKKGKT